MMVGVYKLVNEEKVTRALEGTMVNKGQLVGGLQTRPDWNKLSPEEQDKLLLGEYDRLGGLVVKDGLKLQSGTFYDYKLRKVKEVPEESFVISIDEDLVEVSEDEAKALASAKQKVADLKAKKGDKKRKRRIKSEEIDDKE